MFTRLFGGYHRSFNVHAGGQVFRGVDVPRPALAIAPFEQLAPVSDRNHMPTEQRPAVLGVVRDYTDAQPKVNSEPLSMENFPNTGYVGEMLGGVIDG